MSVLFSKVTVSDGFKTEDFLVGGVPHDEDDLRGWMAYEHFKECVKSNINVHIEAYLYGDGETNIASPEEVAYFYKRITIRPDFLSSRCDNVENYDFTIRCFLHSNAVIGFLEM